MKKQKFEECTDAKELKDSLLQVISHTGSSGSDSAMLYHYTNTIAAEGILNGGYI